MGNTYSDERLKEIIQETQQKLVKSYDKANAALLVTAQRLQSVREQFCYRARYVATDLNADALHLQKTGRTPNGCGYFQSVSALETMNGQINSLSETLSMLMEEAK